MFKKSFFLPISDKLLPLVIQKLRVANSFRVYAISITGLIFAFLVLYLDYLRYLNGKFDTWSIYHYLFINHLCFFLFIIPVLIIQKNKKAFSKGTFSRSPLFFYSWAIFLGFTLVAMSLLTLIDRSSLTMYYIYIIIANFGLLMQHKQRIALNLISFFVIQVAIFYLFFQDKEAYILNSLEALGVTLTSFIVSTTIFNVFVKQVAADKLVEEKNEEIAKEKLRGDQLLHNILPEDIATELKETGRVIPRQFAKASIMMLDFKNFGIKSREMSPAKLISILDYCFKNFDRIISTHGLEKIKTIGDAYLCVGGVPEPNQCHALDSIRAAQDILVFLAEWKAEQVSKKEPFFEARIGIHTGEVIAGVVGDKKFAFDIWGDAVNISARVEAASEANQINISQTTYDLVKGQVNCQHRGKVPIKNGDPIDMYFVK